MVVDIVLDEVEWFGRIHAVEQIRLAEDAHPVHRQIDDGEQRHGAQHRQGNADGDGAVRRSVHARGIENRRFNPLQADEEQQIDRADVLPQVQREQGDVFPVCVAGFQRAHQPRTAAHHHLPEGDNRRCGQENRDEQHERQPRNPPT